MSGSDLAWTIVRPSGLFEAPAVSAYDVAIDHIGYRFTARIDLAHYLLALAGDRATVGKTVVVSSTEHTPTVWQMVRREAAPKPGAHPSRTAPSP